MWRKLCKIRRKQQSHSVKNGKNFHKQTFSMFFKDRILGDNNVFHSINTKETSHFPCKKTKVTRRKHQVLLITWKNSESTTNFIEIHLMSFVLFYLFFSPLRYSSIQFTEDDFDVMPNIVFWNVLKQSYHARILLYWLLRTIAKSKCCWCQIKFYGKVFHLRNHRVIHYGTSQHGNQVGLLLNRCRKHSFRII